MDAGQLRYPVRILTPGTGEEKGRWVLRRPARAGKADSAKRTVFSSVGLAARTAIFTLRRQPIDPGDIIEWMGQWYYVAAFEGQDRMWLSATTGLVFPAECSAKRRTDGLGEGNRPVHVMTDLGSFTGIWTEKYARHAMEEVHAVTEQTLVLVTTKGVELEPGDLVTPQDGPLKDVTLNVTVCHGLDPARNEVELTRKEDV